MKKNNRRQKHLLLLLLILLSRTVNAQFDAAFSNPWVSPNYLNPAHIGTTNKLNVALQHRQQWVGVDNAPKTFLLVADMPLQFLKQDHGVGLVVSTESIGLFENVSLGLQYAYKKEFGNCALQIGAQLGFINQKVDGSKISIPSGTDAHDPNDPNLPKTEIGGFGFDAGLGALFYSDNYYIGLSMTHILGQSIQLDDNLSSKVGQAMYLTAGYDYISPNKKIILTPSLILRTDFKTFQPALNLKALFGERFFGIINYRYGDAVGIGAGVEFQGIRIGYMYDILTSKLNRVSSGSHEVFVSYSTIIKFGNTKSNKKKQSTRML